MALAILEDEAAGEQVLEEGEAVLEGFDFDALPGQGAVELVDEVYF